jgi:hypothetical protein
VYGAAAGTTDQFGIAIVDGARVASSTTSLPVTISELARVSVCDGAGLVILQGDKGTRTIDTSTLRANAHAGVVASGCTPSGRAYFLGEGGLKWQ